jgi:hypothetical protein
MEKHTITVPPNTRARLGEVLLQISDDVLEAINNALQEYHISESKFALLLLLFNTSSDQPLQPSEIANRLRVPLTPTMNFRYTTNIKPTNSIKLRAMQALAHLVRGR